MANAKTLPYPMASAVTKLDVISKPGIEVFPLSATIVKVSYKVEYYIPYQNQHVVDDFNWNNILKLVEMILFHCIFWFIPLLVNPF